MFQKKEHFFHPTDLFWPVHRYPRLHFAHISILAVQAAFPLYQCGDALAPIFHFPEEVQHHIPHHLFSTHSLRGQQMLRQMQTFAANCHCSMQLHRLLQTSASEVAFDNRKPFCRHRIQHTNFDRFPDKQNRLHLPPFGSHSWDKHSCTPRSRSNLFYRQIKRSNS